MSNPLDELASEYVLGTLPAEQRAEVERRLQHDAPLRAAVDAWEQRLLPLTALAEPVPPSHSYGGASNARSGAPIAASLGGTCLHSGAAWPAQGWSPHWYWPRCC